MEMTELLLSTVKLDWLKLKILNDLMELYDEKLLPWNPQEIKTSLDLSRIVDSYFQMLPPRRNR